MVRHDRREAPHAQPAHCPAAPAVTQYSGLFGRLHCIVPRLPGRLPFHRWIDAIGLPAVNSGYTRRVAHSRLAEWEQERSTSKFSTGS